jgi:alpha-beta hydrolase superfamily lysophospholipase
MFGNIKNASGENLDYTFHAGDKSSQHIVVLGHGVTGNKDRPFLVELADNLSNAGIPTIRFSFSGNGNSDGEFTQSTISKEIGDLASVLDVLDNHIICYVGHSMGSAVGVLSASQDNRIKLLVSLAGMVETKAFAQREFGDVTPDKGFMWDEPTCPLSQAYMDDLTQINTVVDCASKISVPWLLVHGTEDDVVLIEDSQKIYAQANEPKELLTIEDANHVFSDDSLSPMVEKVVDWIRDQLALTS